jgi:clan AA aspartic protease
MIQGTVSARMEAVVRLHLRGPNGTTTDVDAVVDTGFTSALTLPPGVITSLGLVRQTSGTAVLADGTIRQFDIFTVEVEWGGSWRNVLVSGVGVEVLMGMRLLAGPRLGVEANPGGVVEITPLP